MSAESQYVLALLLSWVLGALLMFLGIWGSGLPFARPARHLRGEEPEIPDLYWLLRESKSSTTEPEPEIPDLYWFLRESKSSTTESEPDTEWFDMEMTQEIALPIDMTPISPVTPRPFVPIALRSIKIDPTRHCGLCNNGAGPFLSVATPGVCPWCGRSSWLE